ncbi:MAG: class I tRNA ligase family protein [Candidatus Omnitrophica bacterium]|nr:class I tRNA ligase family protein [Candidatus Omnitrophota bacterium]
MAAEANRYIETKSPWKLSREDPQRLETVLHVLAEVIRIIAILLEPFMPSVAQGIWQQLGLGETPRRLRDALRWPWLTSSQRIGTRAVLFPKVPS